MAEETTAVAATRPLNILIVDDSATMRTMIRRVVDLTELPLGTVYEATNGLEALHILETCMGYELLTEIARREAWKDILRIVISTDGSRLRQEEVRELNVNLYIRKPFRPEVVRNVLSRIASTHHR